MLALSGALFFGFVPMFFFAYMFYWIDRYEKEPKALLTTVFLWGVIVASAGAFIINTIFGVGVFLVTNSEITADVTTGSIIAPIVEESLKGLAVLIIFLIFRREFDSVLDGIIYAGIVALGFAATENSFYIYSYGYQESGWSGFWFLVFVRVILVGLQHPFYTAFIGIGLAIARLNRRLPIKVLAPMVGFGLAIFTHSFHNTLATLLGGIGFGGLVIGTALDWTGWIFMAGIIAWAIWHENRYLRKHLVEEVNLGIITATQYHTAISTLSQTVARVQSMFNGKYLATVNFYQLCGELAHKKQQYLTLGDEEGNTAIIQKLRVDIKNLSPGVQTS